MQKCQRIFSGRNALLNVMQNGVYYLQSVNLLKSANEKNYVESVSKWKSKIFTKIFITTTIRYYHRTNNNNNNNDNDNNNHNSHNNSYVCNTHMPNL